MTNFDYVQKTIDIFEDSLSGAEPITTVASLAAKIGYSPHHLGRLFQALCGEPLGRYIARRRLAEAAERVRERGESAAQASLSLGWEDYSAFSRAVRKEFGVSPSALKSAASLPREPARRARPVLSERLRRDLAEPELAYVEPFRATGMVFYMGPNEKTFHRPWRIFSAHRNRIAGIIGGDTWQFSSWSGTVPAEDEGIWIHCAVRTDPLAEQDPLFFSRDLSAMRVLRFAHEGPVETLYDTYRRIWLDYLPRSAFVPAGNQEYQHYPEGADAIEICIPVSG